MAPMTRPRDLVYLALDHEDPERAPRHLWKLPWASLNYPGQLACIQQDLPDDIVRVPGGTYAVPRTDGDPYAVGEYTDHWGCRWTNRQAGIVGEIKQPLISGENWEDRDRLIVPVELQDVDRAAVDDFCRNTDRFVLSAASPRIFERLQFIRGTEQLLIDLKLKPQGFFEVFERVHRHYCRVLEAWAQTDVDALSLTDDWGSQRALLVHPDTWAELFRPVYKEYISIAHRYGKRIFMHSDGYILPILPHLVKLGLDAINCQIFCMGVESLRQFRGRLTFWGEIDRQHLLPRGSRGDINDAVAAVWMNLWQNGGCIAQCEFGAGANPENVYEVFAAWNRLSMCRG